jgi:tRNA-dihydrouridine synthase A
MTLARPFSVAPMMDCTDRHCRYFHRLLSKETIVYSEMIVDKAIIFGNRDRFLSYSPEEHPVALQLGGNDPKVLSEATKIAIDFGYDEVNLNVGCPSDRVNSGNFGAALMRNTTLVSECVEAMVKVAGVTPISVKSRIGVDEQNPEEILPFFYKKYSNHVCFLLWWLTF